MSERAIKHNGTWPPIMAWLDNLGRNNGFDRFPVPFGTRPPVRMVGEGTLAVDTAAGTELCAPGEVLAFDSDQGFVVLR